jgi:hypothetical protein
MGTCKRAATLLEAAGEMDRMWKDRVRDRPASGYHAGLHSAYRQAAGRLRELAEQCTCLEPGCTALAAAAAATLAAEPIREFICGARHEDNLGPEAQPARWTYPARCPCVEAPNCGSPRGGRHSSAAIWGGPDYVPPSGTPPGWTNPRPGRVATKGEE